MINCRIVYEDEKNKKNKLLTSVYRFTDSKTDQYTNTEFLKSLQENEDVKDLAIDERVVDLAALLVYGCKNEKEIKEILSVGALTSGTPYEGIREVKEPTTFDRLKNKLGKTKENDIDTITHGEAISELAGETDVLFWRNSKKNEWEYNTRESEDKLNFKSLNNAMDKIYPNKAQEENKNKSNKLVSLINRFKNGLKKDKQSDINTSTDMGMEK